MYLGDLLLLSSVEARSGVLIGVSSILWYFDIEVIVEIVPKARSWAGKRKCDAASKLSHAWTPPAWMR